jgi:hypothetical protein
VAEANTPLPVDAAEEYLLKYDIIGSASVNGMVYPKQIKTKLRRSVK